MKQALEIPCGDREGRTSTPVSLISRLGPSNEPDYLLHSYFSGLGVQFEIYGPFAPGTERSPCPAQECSASPDR